MLVICRHQNKGFCMLHFWKELLQFYCMNFCIAKIFQLSWNSYFYIWFVYHNYQQKKYNRDEQIDIDIRSRGKWSGEEKVVNRWAECSILTLLLPSGFLFVKMRVLVSAKALQTILRSNGPSQSLHQVYCNPDFGWNY